MKRDAVVLGAARQGERARLLAVDRNVVARAVERHVVCARLAVNARSLRREVERAPDVRDVHARAEERLDNVELDARALRVEIETLVFDVDAARGRQLARAEARVERFEVHVLAAERGARCDHVERLAPQLARPGAQVCRAAHRAGDSRHADLARRRADRRKLRAYLRGRLVGASELRDDGEDRADVQPVERGFERDVVFPDARDVGGELRRAACAISQTSVRDAHRRRVRVKRRSERAYVAAVDDERGERGASADLRVVERAAHRAVELKAAAEIDPVVVQRVLDRRREIRRDDDPLKLRRVGRDQVDLQIGVALEREAARRVQPTRARLKVRALDVE